MSVAACTGVISPEKLKQYQELDDRQALAKTKRERKRKQVDVLIDDTQAEVLATMTGREVQYTDPSTIQDPIRRRSPITTSTQARKKLEGCEGS